MFSRLFGNSEKAAQSEGEQIQVVDPATIRTWWDAGQVVLVDVRERDEHAAERIEGAINLPLSSFNPAQIPKPEAGQHLVIHCRSGVRCGTASGHLAASGWKGEIVRMRGGILGWKAADYPTRRGS
jgi:rhodanese-related sulfurtransferase